MLYRQNIRSMETHKRSLLKTVIYRITVSIILATISWHFTGDLTKTSAITLVYNIVVIIFYYIHERIWARIKWGRLS